MKIFKRRVWRTLVSVLLAAAMAVTLAACGAATDTGLSSEPGGGKWVDSDVDGYVKAEDEFRLQDDFAAAVNKEWIVSTPFDPILGNGAATDVQGFILQRYQDVLDDEGITGPNAEALRAVRELALDWDKRNGLGVEPLRKYLSDIESISSIEELTEYQASTDLDPFGIGLLMPGKVTVQIQYVDKSTLDLAPPTYSLGNKANYLNFGGTALEAKEKNDTRVTYFLERLGYPKNTIKAILKGNYNIETHLARAENSYTAHEEFTQAQTTREGVTPFLNGYPLFEILDGRGYADCDSIHLDYMYLAGLKGIYDEKHLDELKDFLIVHTINATSLFLDKESFDYMLELEVSRTDKNAKFYQPDDNMIFSNALRNGAFIPAMDELYLQKYYPDDEKIDEYTEIINDLIDSYRVMIAEEDWMSDTTKAVAQEKLDSMAIHVVRPDNSADYSDVSIKGFDEGGSLLDAVAEGRRHLIRHFNERAANPEADRYFWDIYETDTPTTLPNCFYSPQQNAFYILAGWAAITDYLYGDDATYEQLLGCIGAVAGHEISHGFDADGSHYDKYGRRYDDDGNDIDWMERNDRARLDERADKLASYLSLARPIPGKKRVTGQTVKNETMADMGGIKAVMYLAKKELDFDYDGFFRSYATLWAKKTTEDVELASMEDVHPLNFYRININLQQFDEFLETYDIKPGDAMYLEPERRVNVW